MNPEMVKVERGLAAAIEDTRIQAAAWPRGSADRELLITMAKAFEDFGRGLREGSIRLTWEELDRIQAVLGGLQEACRLMNDDPKILEIYRRVKQENE